MLSSLLKYNLKVQSPVKNYQSFCVSKFVVEYNFHINIMGEFVDELPPSIPPRPGGPSSSYPSAYPSIGTGGYSAYTAPGLNSSLGRRVGYNSSIYDSYGR